MNWFKWTDKKISISDYHFSRKEAANWPVKKNQVTVVSWLRLHSWDEFHVAIALLKTSSLGLQQIACRTAVHHGNIPAGHVNIETEGRFRSSLIFYSRSPNKGQTHSLRWTSRIGGQQFLRKSFHRGWLSYYCQSGGRKSAFNIMLHEHFYFKRLNKPCDLCKI